MNRSLLFHIGALLGAIYGSSISIILHDVNQTTLIIGAVIMIVFYIILRMINNRYGKEVKA